MPKTPDTVSLYRIENPNIPSTPDGITSHEDFIGQWFSPDLNTALKFLPSATRTYGPGAGVVDGAQLVIAHVPADQLEDMHVYQNPIASTMDVENDNYLVPRDGSIATDVIVLDETLGELRGKLGNIRNDQLARRRVYSLLGAHAARLV